jgi:hypothetical protein
MLDRSRRRAAASASSSSLSTGLNCSIMNDTFAICRALPGAEELRAVWSRYHVRDLLVSEHDWSWVMLELAEDGLPVTKVPRSPQWLALQWSQFYDAVLERRLSHDGDRALSRHVSDLSLIAGPSGPRPNMDVAEGQPIAAALAVMIAYEGVTRLGPGVTPIIVLPTGVG